MGLFKRDGKPRVDPEWAESHTTIKKHYKHILLPISGVAFAGTVAVAVAVPIMVAKIAKEEATSAFEKIIPMGGTRVNFEKGKPITYLALGDSITAGYNGFMKADGTATGASKEGGDKGDYFSYADFLASDLNKNGMLKEYRNFAVSGYTIPQSRNQLLRDQGNLALLQKTDLITLSLGANDFLSAVQVLDIPFRSLTSGSATSKKEPTITQINTARDDLFKSFGISQAGDDKNYSESPSAYAAKKGIGKLIQDSFDKLINITKTGEIAGILDIQKDLYDKVFGLIQLDLATYINELHQAAPNAQIEVMGYAFPFHKLPTNLVEDVIKDKNASISDSFDKFISTLKATTEKANFVDFFDINKLKEFGPHSDIIKYPSLKADYSNGKELVNDEWDRVMPNAFDIHPSTYGHQVISGHLFEELMKKSGHPVIPYVSLQKLSYKDKEEGKELYNTYSYAGLSMIDSYFMTSIGVKQDDITKPDGIDIFKIKDEAPIDSHFGALLGLNLLNSESIVKLLSTVLSKAIDTTKLSENYQAVVESFTKDKAGNPYTDTAAKYSGIAEALLKVVNPGDAKRLITSFKSGSNILQKVKNIAPILSKFIAQDLPEGDFKPMVLELLRALGKADFSAIPSGGTIMSHIGDILVNKNNADFITDFIALFMSIKNMPEDSQILNMFRKLVSGLSVKDRASLFDVLNNDLPMGLVVNKGIWLPNAGTAGEFFNKGDSGTYKPLIDSFISAAERMGLTLTAQGASGGEQLGKMLVATSAVPSQMTEALTKIGLHDGDDYTAHPEYFYDQE